jgi:hypothetical protein
VDRPLRIGLTGGIASGKTTVARLFADLGVPVLDTDQIARDVVEPGQPALGEVVAAFGPEILGPDGRLDRPGLRARVLWPSLASTVTWLASSSWRAMVWAPSPKLPSIEPAVTWSQQPASIKGCSWLGSFITCLLRSGWAIRGRILRCNSHCTSLSLPGTMWPWGNSSSMIL